MRNRILGTCVAAVFAVTTSILVIGCGSTASFAPPTTTPPSFSIGGTISPAPDTSGTTVALSGQAGATTTADANGNYVFNGVTSGNYTVTPSNTDIVFTPSAQTVNINGSSNTAVNFSSPGKLKLINIVAATNSVAKGTTDQFTAIGTFGDGSTKDVTRSATWTSSNTAVFSMSGTGLGTGVATGPSTITATQKGVTSNAIAVSVTSATLQSITISTANSSIAKGTSAQFTAIGTFSDGSTQNLTASAAWLSSNTSVAAINAGGFATGLAVGSTNITATQNGIKSNSLALAVTAATLQSITITTANTAIAKGTSVQFTATGTFSDGSTQNLTGSATWNSSNTSTVTIGAGGVASAAAVGSSNITATQTGVTSNSIALNVTAATLQSINITTTTSSIAKGTSEEFNAMGTFSDGTTQDLTNSAIWTSSNTAAATINSSGLATGTGVGSSNITATQSGITANTIVLTVTAATLQSIAISATSTSIAKGTTDQFAAIGTFTDGTTQNLTRSATWSSSNTAAVSIASTGIATGVGTGSSNMSAAQAGITSNTIALNVTAATLQSLNITAVSTSIAKGTTDQFAAVGTFTDGTTQNLTSSAIWTSANTAAATISTSGLASGAGIGSSNITATQSGVVSNTIGLSVTAATLQSINITATATSIAKGTIDDFTATGTFTDGTTQNLTNSATWTSSNTSVATISSSGVVTGGGIGSATITATQAGVSANPITLSVTAATLQSITITAPSTSIAKGTTDQFSAIGTFSDGTTQNLTNSVTWNSSSTAVASISTNGLVTGAGVGSSNITVTQSGITSNTIAFTVTAATLQSINITATSTSIAKGTTDQFTATGTFTDGTTQNLTSSATWTSSNTAAATISTSGLARGSGVGTANITATQSGITSNAIALTVTAATLQSITINAAKTSIANGTTDQFTATGTFTDGTTQNLTSSATWTSSNTAAATISTSALATGAGVGSSNITATQSGITSNTIALTVTAAILQSISITAPKTSIAKGTTDQFTATGTFTDGTTQNLTSSAVWTSSNPAAATISTGGLVAGAGVGGANITATQSGITSNAIALTVTAATLQSIMITDPSTSIAKGTTDQFTATGTFTDGTTQNLTNSATWTSSNTAAATISTSGLATGAGVGSSNITATQSGITSNTIALTVTAATLVSISVTPSSVAVNTGASVQFTATGTYSDGSTQDLTNSVTWDVSTGPPPIMASTAGGGDAVTTSTRVSARRQPRSRAVTFGQALTMVQTRMRYREVAYPRVKLYLDLAVGRMESSYAPLHIAQRLSDSCCFDRQGRSMRQRAWQFGMVCLIAAASMDLSCGSAGVGTNTTGNPITGAQVSVAPTPVTVQKGTTQQFAATVTGLSSTAVNWTVSNTAGGNSTVGTITTSGLYTAPATVPSPATVTVTATSQVDTTKSGSASVTISATPPPVAVTITPPSATVQISTTKQFSATVTGSTNTAVNWSVNGTAGGNSTVGTVSNSGLYTAPAGVPSPATVSVTATSQADTTKSASAPVTISAGSGLLTVVTSNLANGTVSVAYSSTLAATGGSAPYTWSIAAGSLPAGLSLNSGTGIISGTPTAAGQSTFTVQVADSASHTAQAQLSITVASANLQGTPGATATQYVLTYIATQATTQGCQVEVSESSTYTPLVHALDPALFLNSNFDGQTAAGPHTFVVGRRTYQQENANPPSITVSAGQASRNGSNTPSPNNGNGNGIVTVNFTGQPFVVGDDIIVTGGAADGAYETSWARVIKVAANSFEYGVLTTGTDTNTASLTITRANHYSLALQNDTTHYYRISGCVPTPVTGTFNTMNWPNGNTWADVWPLDANGNQIFPTIPEDKSGAQHFVDPFTGTLVKPFTTASDADGISWHSNYGSPSGSQHHCSYQADSNGWFYCIVDFAHAGSGFLYSVKTSTGETHFLGQLFWTANPECGQVGIQPGATSGFDENDPRSIWYVCNGSGANAGHTYVVKATFNGNPAVDAAAASQVSIVNGFPTTITTNPNSFDVMLHAFDPSFIPSQYANIVPWGTEQASPYLGISLQRFNQGSPAWHVVYNTQTNTIAGAQTSFGLGVSAASCSGTSCSNAPQWRWCGSHGLPGLGNSAGGWDAFGTETLSGNGCTGPWEITLNQSSGLNATDSTDGITVTSPSTAGSPGDPYAVEVPPDGINFLDIARVGDVFQWEDNSENVMVTVRNSSSSLTVARGCHAAGSPPKQWICDGTGEGSHSNGAKMRAVCEPHDVGPGSVVWNFANDPHGQDNTSTTVIWDSGYFLGGHGGAKYPYDFSEGNNVRTNSTWDAAFYKSIHNYAVLPIAFNKTPTTINAASFIAYPHYYPNDTTNVTWGWDTTSYAGGEFSGEFGNQVSGTTYIYKYVFANSSGNVHAFNAAVPYFSVNLGTPLRDISGANALLTDAPADNNKFCVTKTAGECWSGSQPGDVYANLSGYGSSTSTCVGSEGGIGGGWCVENMSPIAHGMNQISLLPANQIGTNANDGTPIYGMGDSRKLVSGAFMPPRLILTRPQDLPDETWAYWDSCIADPYVTSEGPFSCLSEIYMAKIPPQPPADNIDRTVYQDVTGVQIAALGTGATHARVKYGYEEYGPRSSFFCTQRQETCYYSNQSLGLNLTVSLTAIGAPQHVLFYEVEYLDASNNVVATSPVQAVAVP